LLNDYAITGYLDLDGDRVNKLRVERLAILFGSEIEEKEMIWTETVYEAT
jgi:hypothetical protein